MKKILVTVFALAAMVAPKGFAADNPAAVELARDVCSKCHGPDGVSQSSLFPRLAGQQAEYIQNQLHGFRDRTRSDAHAQAYMWGIAGPLTDMQISGLAEYYSSRKPVRGPSAADPALAAKGKDIYFSGVPERNIPACAACHGEQAQGEGPVPRLAGQHADYIYRQLRDFRTEMRVNETMHQNALQMTDEDAAALAQYLSSL